MHATISARNRESGFPSRPRRAHHFLTDGPADNITVANICQVIRMEIKNERILPPKKYAYNQSNRFFVVFISARCNKRVYSRPFRMKQESFLKSAFRLPIPTHSPFHSETRRASERERAALYLEQLNCHLDIKGTRHPARG